MTSKWCVCGALFYSIFTQYYNHVFTHSPQCLLPPGSSGNANKLCTCDCSDDGKRAACQVQSDIYQQASVNQTLLAAARTLTDRNMQLFNVSGVLGIVKTLRGMSQLDPVMPPDSFKLYQNIYTPNFTCSMSNASATPVLVAGSEGNTVAPLGTWEESQNLRDGSVVLRGTLIGGERMLRLEEGASQQNDAAPQPKTPPSKVPAQPQAKTTPSEVAQNAALPPPLVKPSNQPIRT